jgi:hypothetical protein
MGTSRSRVFSSAMFRLPITVKRLSSRLLIHERYALKTISDYLHASLWQLLQTLSPALCSTLTAFLFSLGSTPLANSLRASSSVPWHLTRDFRSISPAPASSPYRRSDNKPPVFGAIRVNQQYHAVAISKFIGFCVRQPNSPSSSEPYESSPKGFRIVQT